ncbi:MAG TPA: ion transporter, partial [Myxococcota bacterium]
MSDDDVPGRRRALHLLRERLWRIIFLSDTPAGRAFDIGLLLAIAVSVLTVMLDSVPGINQVLSNELRVVEWSLTALFSIEFAVRLWVVRRPRAYLFSFFGVVDLVSLLPSYLEVVLAGSHYLMTVRVLRLLRMFRVLKMGQHIGEASVLLSALRSSSRKISVFLLSVCTLICIEGTLVYLVEHGNNPAFESIPQAMYWAI